MVVSMKMRNIQYNIELLNINYFFRTTEHHSCVVQKKCVFEQGSLWMYE
jgi:hypothetical protein